MELLTTQAAYEKIRAHFSQPDVERAYEETLRSCVYRGLGVDGERDPHSPIRCAFGVLIPDDRYSPDMEERFADTLIGDPRFNLQGLFLDVSTKFLQEAQYEHDNIGVPFETFIERLDALAHDYNLTVPSA